MNQETHPISRRGETRFLGWAILFALTFPTLLTYVYFVHLRHASELLQHLVYSGGKIVQFGFPLFWVLVIERRRLKWSWPHSQGLAAGFTFGLLVAVGMWALYYFWLAPAGIMEQAAAPVRAKVSGFGIDDLKRYIAFGIFYTFVHSLAEEYYWRWYVFAEATRIMPRPAANLVSSLGFTAHHVLLLGTFFGYGNPVTWIFSAAIAVGGAVWAWMYGRYRSLYPVWLSHALVDAAIFSIGYHLVRDLMK